MKDRRYTIRIVYHIMMKRYTYYKKKLHEKQFCNEIIY